MKAYPALLSGINLELVSIKKRKAAKHRKRPIVPTMKHFASSSNIATSESN